MNILRGTVIGRALLVLSFATIVSQRVEAGSISLAWDANAEVDIAGYILSYGTASNTYTTTVDVSNVTAWTLAGLTDGQQYFFALRAYSSGGAQSLLSNEASGMASTAGTPAQLTAPAPGSVLTGSSVQFQWSTGTGVSAYRLSVGTTIGGTNTFDLNVGTNVSQTVTGLPTNGSAVFARIWSLIGTMWRFNDYNYTASAACSYSLSPATSSVAAAATTGTVGLTTSGSCAWTALSNAAWITVTGGASGTGNGTVSYSVAANSTTAARTGTVTVAGQTLTVNQAFSRKKHR